jgi:thiosulfate dehydrogenase [quinone] large subunit
MKIASAPKTPTRPDPRPSRRAPLHRRATLADSWLDMPWSMRILRAFLGVTFLYAGMQKFLDGGFLHSGSSTYIGTQLDSFSHGVPAAPLMGFLGHVPLLTGVGVALLETAVGIATLLGVGLMLASALGLAINLTLWLSFTWHTHPYFLGSDSIYAVAWAALLFGAYEAERVRNPGRMPTMTERIDGLGRREVLRGGLVAGLAVVLAAVGKTFSSLPSRSSVGLGASGAQGAGTGSGGQVQGPTTGGGAGTAGSGSGGGTGGGGRQIGTLSQLPVGQAMAFTGPGGIPGALVRLANGSVVAYSRVCTHAGCSVGWDAGAHLLVCPCHGAEFDPAKRASPLPGSPTSTPLQYIPVTVDQASGKIFLK